MHVTLFFCVMPRPKKARTDEEKKQDNCDLAFLFVTFGATCRLLSDRLH